MKKMRTTKNRHNPISKKYEERTGKILPLGFSFSRTRIYKIWVHMIDRCRDKRNRLYGGKGITVCDEWKDFIAFYIWAKETGYNDELTIDRIDYRGNYEPSNCRWVDIRTQANNKSNVRKYEYNGELHTMTEWSEIMNINYGALWERLNVLGWSIEKALTTPVRDDGKH